MLKRPMGQSMHPDPSSPTYVPGAQLSVGLRVGRELIVGSGLGRAVGRAVGRGVGAGEVGTPVGSVVGSGVGRAVGRAVGNGVVGRGGGW